MSEEEPTEIQYVRGDRADEAAPCVVVLTGRKVGRVFKLRPAGTVLGRAIDTDIVLDDDGVSRVHCVLQLTDGRWTVQDLGSTNGTFVGERTVGKSPLALKDGDRIRLGADLILRFGTQDEIERQFLDHLYKSATRDSLTGLSNRRHFQERLDSEVAWHRRHEAPLTLLFVDIDHFKLVNDSHGHLAGDEVLVQIAELIQAICRIEDVVARWGGEEFVLLLRQTPSLPGRQVAERLRRIVEQRTFLAAGQKLKITVSVGVATGVGEALTSSVELVEEADTALYAAKDAGRNRVVPAPG
ncbi:MAG: GGDEF domain-containing protein [Myxococcota bacterium]